MCSESTVALNLTFGVTPLGLPEDRRYLAENMRSGISDLPPKHCLVYRTILGPFSPF